MFRIYFGFRISSSGFIFACILVFMATSVLADDLRDVKPPVDFPVNYFWLIALVAGLVIAGLTFLIRYILKRNSQKKGTIIIKLPHEIALERLQKLKAENFPAQGKVKEYFAELSVIARQYIESRFGIRAPEMTTPEFLQRLRTSGDLNTHQKDLLKEFLNASDMVKFAKYGPNEEEIQKSYLFVQRFIEETIPATVGTQKEGTQ